ncbi:MAG: hypothetical protein KKA19_09970 [Candidatus Margulisbacteria bacterium]|nr:hypothetical protein [Candidatus Margulisiibacteriota bacterium]
MLLRTKQVAKYIPEDIKEIAAILGDNENDCYIVGGGIRDLLIAKHPKEFDLATDASPETVQNLFEKTIPTGIKYGTVTIIYNEAQYQITTFRTEGKYSDGRHPDQVEFTKDIKRDLARRDFTINAIAYNAVNFEMVDEFNGLEDLKNGIIRAVGDPRKRLEEDGLRAFRGIRFAAQLNFKIEEQTEAAIVEFIKDWPNLASKERIHDELIKILNTEQPSLGLNYLNFPNIDQYDKQVRLAALIKDKPELIDLIQEKKEKRWVERLLKYDLNLKKALLQVTDLKVDGIDLMELGLRGENIGQMQEKLLDIIVERKSLNKKDKLIEIAKNIMAGKELELPGVDKEIMLPKGEVEIV